MKHSKTKLLLGSLLAVAALAACTPVELSSSAPAGNSSDTVPSSQAASDNSSAAPSSVDETVSVTGVSLNQQTLAMEVGATAQLEASVLPTNATNKAVGFTSNKPAIASVDNTGLVTALSAGEATITVTTEDGGFTATCAVTVEEADPNKSIGITTFDGPASLETVFPNNVRHLDSVDPEVLKIKAADPSTREENTFFENEEGTFDTYKVGNLNPFVLSFTASGLDEDLETVAVSDLDLVVNLYEEIDGEFGEASVLGTYAQANEDKTEFQFNAAAVGKTFKMRVAPNADSYASVARNCYFEHVFEVVEGYNVYSWEDLTKMDNRSADYYQENAATGETAHISCFILHKDINVTTEDIPNALKWTEADCDAYITAYGADWTAFYNKIKYNAENDFNYTYEYLKEDGTYGSKFIESEADAKAVFVNSLRDSADILCHNLGADETFTLEGNYFNIDYSHVAPVIFFRDADDGLLSNYLSSEGGHSSLFYDVDNTCVGHFTWKNFSSKGNGSRTADDISPAGGLILIKQRAKQGDVSNVLAYSTFTTFIVEDGDGEDQRGVYNFDRVKAFDSYNIMFYNWGSTMNITNSIIMRAGGALIINDEMKAVDDPNTAEDERALFRPANTAIENSYLESWVSGTEAWFSAKGVTALVALLSSMAGPTGFVGANRAAFGQHHTFAEKKALSTGEKALYVNLIALDLHASDFLGNNYLQGTALKGSYTVDGARVLDMNDLATPGTDIYTYKTLMDAQSAGGFFFTGSKGGSGASYNAEGTEGIHWQNNLSQLNPAFEHDCLTFSSAQGAIAQLNAAGVEPATQAATKLQNDFDNFYSSPYMATYLSPAYGLNYLGLLLGAGNYVID